MQAAQWVIAAITAIFVAVVAFLQWRTAQQKAVLDLFDRRHAIYEIVRNAVSTMTGIFLPERRQDSSTEMPSILGRPRSSTTAS